MSQPANSATWPSAGSLFAYIKRDVGANPRNPKIQAILVGLRVCQVLMGTRLSPRLVSIPFVATYRIVTEFFLGIEIPPKTIIGPGLCVYHGFGLVVNDHCIIGCDVTLRNGVTIGNREVGGGVPRIGNNVEIGAGAIILGDIELGSGCRVGAGAVVLSSVDEGDTVVGNPARSLRALQLRPGSQDEV